MIYGSARYRCRVRNRTGSEYDNDYDNEKFFDGLFKTFGLRDYGALSGYCVAGPTRRRVPRFWYAATERA